MRDATHANGRPRAVHFARNGTGTDCGANAPDGFVTVNKDEVTCGRCKKRIADDAPRVPPTVIFDDEELLAIRDALSSDRSYFTSAHTKGWSTALERVTAWAAGRLNVRPK